MFHEPQRSAALIRDTAWLSALVHCMEEIEQTSVQCDESLLNATAVHLAVPAGPVGYFASTFSLRN